MSDFVFTAYNSLLDAGWKMGEIDQMDMLGYWKVRAWKARKDKESNKTEAKKAYIDEVWPE